MQLAGLTAPCAPARADAPLAPSDLALLKRSFAHGREYFVLRSGRAQLIVQSDRFDAVVDRIVARRVSAWTRPAASSPALLMR